MDWKIWKYFSGSKGKRRNYRDLGKVELKKFSTHFAFVLQNISFKFLVSTQAREDQFFFFFFFFGFSLYCI
jgi:hypothetical protein